MSKLFSFPLNQNNSAMARYGREGEGGTGRACRGGKGGGAQRCHFVVSTGQTKTMHGQTRISEEEAKQKGDVDWRSCVLRQKSFLITEQGTAQVRTRKVLQ